MRAITLIARRELYAYLRTWQGYLIIAFLLFIDGFLFQAMAMKGNKLSASVLSEFFYYASGPTMIGAVLLSMRLLAEERQSGTITLLYSSPVRDSEIVVGKYIAALLFLGLATVLTIYMPAMIFIHGKVSYGHIAAGYLGLILLGAAALAIGTFGSSLVRSQVIAALISGGMIGTLLVCWAFGAISERPLTEIWPAMALHGTHFAPFQSGIIHLRDVVYYLGVTYIALFSATRVLEARRWR